MQNIGREKNGITLNAMILKLEYPVLEIADKVSRNLQIR